MKISVYKNANLLYVAEFAPEDLIDGTEIFIGRAQDCHLIIEDFQVSRHHAVLIVNKGALALKKLSKFGDLLLNGNPINESTIKQSDRISVGEHIIEFSELTSQLLTDPAINEKSETPAEVNSENSLEQPSISNSEDLAEVKEEDSSQQIGEETLAEFDSVDDANDDFDENSLDDMANEENNLDQDPSDNSYDDSFGDSSDNEFSDSSNENGNDFQDDSQQTENSETSDFNNDGFGGDGDGFGNEDGGFGGDDGGFGGGFGDDSSESTQVFQSFASYSLKIFGEYAPFDNYKIEDSEIFIGRDTEKCQIILNDPEVSTIHAKIKKTLINCVLEDLQSSNGTILNGERINKSELTNGDEFVIGDTSFTVQISSDLIEAEKDVLMPVQENQEVEVIQEIEEEVDFDEFGDEGEFSEDLEPEPKSLIEKIKKDPKKRKIAIFAVVGFIALFLFDSDKPSKKSSENKKKTAKTAEKGKKGETDPKAVGKKVLPPDVIEKLEQNYALALAKYEEGNYEDATVYLDTVIGIDPDYKDAQTLKKLVSQGFAELTRIEKEKKEEEERLKRLQVVKELVEKAQNAVDKKDVAGARTYFTQILEKDPENIDVPQLKMIIDAHVKAEEEKKMAAKQAEIRRKNMVDALNPGKTLFLRGDWYEAIGKLEKFTKKEGMDEDLIKEATNMLKESRQKLSDLVNPLLGRARSFREGQDLKRAYETYGEILKHHPTSEEALNERQEIKESLDTRSRKIYREALVSESLSLFSEAKEKFQEVQQVSPVGSEYYIKATNKLKEYLE